jgi:hypothetical protein
LNTKEQRARSRYDTEALLESAPNTSKVQIRTSQLLYI